MPLGLQQRIGTAAMQQHITELSASGTSMQCCQGCQAGNCAVAMQLGAACFGPVVCLVLSLSFQVSLQCALRTPKPCNPYAPNLRASRCCTALQGALLLLLFRGSHQLEHRLTEKAAGGLQRLFDSVPDRAVVVEVEEGSNAPRVATSQEVWTGKACAWDRQSMHTSHDNKQQGIGVVWAITFDSLCHMTCVLDDCNPTLSTSTYSQTYSITLDCQASEVYVLNGGVLFHLQVAASDVAIGQHVLVRPGEQVPLDGVIIWGTANLSLQVRRGCMWWPCHPVCCLLVAHVSSRHGVIRQQYQGGQERLLRLFVGSSGLSAAAAAAAGVSGCGTRPRGHVVFGC